MTSDDQLKRLRLEVRFDRQPIEGHLYDRDDDRNAVRPFAGWLGLMSAIDDATRARTAEQEVQQ